MNFIKQLIRNYWMLSFCIIGFLIEFVACYPGFMCPDAIDQYTQSLTHRYDDWHPPVMAGLWALFDYVYKGPQTMLVFQLGLLWTSVFLLLTLMPDKRWRFCIILFALAPFVQNFTAYITKDANMALTWLLAFTLMLRYAYHNKRVPVWMAVFIFILLTYGCWVRTNAFPGVLPLCTWLVWLVLRDKKNVLKISALLVLAAFLASGHWIQDAVFKTRKTHPEFKLFLHGITGIYVAAGENYFPDTLLRYKGFDTTLLKKYYTPATFDDIVEKDTLIKIPEAINYIVPTKAAWIRAVRKHPLVYLANRFDGYLYFLRIKVRDSSELTTLFPWIDDNKYGFTVDEEAPLYLLYNGAIEVQSPMPYMQPWFWMLLNILLLLAIRRIRNTALRQGFAVLVISGIFYQALMFWVFPIDTDFRYFYWNCIGCSLAICLWIADRFVKEI